VSSTDFWSSYRSVVAPSLSSHIGEMYLESPLENLLKNPWQSLEQRRPHLGQALVILQLEISLTRRPRSVYNDVGALPAERESMPKFIIAQGGE
jgi:hypothetical protein